MKEGTNCSEQYNRNVSFVAERTFLINPTLQTESKMRNLQEITEYKTLPMMQLCHPSYLNDALVKRELCLFP